MTSYRRKDRDLRIGGTHILRNGVDVACGKVQHHGIIMDADKQIRLGNKLATQHSFPFTFYRPPPNAMSRGISPSKSRIGNFSFCLLLLFKIDYSHVHVIIIVYYLFIFYERSLKPMNYTHKTNKYQPSFCFLN